VAHGAQAEAAHDTRRDPFYQPCAYVLNDINAASYSSPLVSDVSRRAGSTKTSTQRPAELRPSSR
jgi:hypothetical protein